MSPRNIALTVLLVWALTVLVAHHFTSTDLPNTTLVRCLDSNASITSTQSANGKVC